MKALVYTDIKTLTFKEEKIAVANDDEELIKVDAAGICGSDMHAYHGLDERKIPPLILGHEISGIKLKNNTPVVINPLITCMKCQDCLNGRENLCIKRESIGTSKPVLRSGGFAEFVAAPKRNIFSVSTNMNLHHVALTEPTAVALHAVKIAENNSFTNLDQSNILIIGGGAIGLLVALVLETKEANNITILDTNQKRLNVCQQASSSLIAHPNDKRIKTNSYDIVFDAVGFENTRRKSIECIKQGGIIIHMGLSQSSGEFDFRKTTLQEITFFGSFCYTNNDFKRSLDMLIAKELGDLTWLDYRPLKDGAAAFREIHDSTTSSPKIILIP